MISISHFSKSKLFDTSDWSSIWDLTLTLKQALKHPERRETKYRPIWYPIDEYQCRSAFRHFMNLLNRAVYGNAVRRNGKQLRVLPILEKEEHGRWHFHAAIEPPPHMEPDQFKTVIRRCWSKVDWAYQMTMVRPNADRGWINYMLKNRQKSEFARLSRTRRRARLDRDGNRKTRRCAHRKERPPCARRIAAAIGVWSSRWI
jgi:hypothetical protein